MSDKIDDNKLENPSIDLIEAGTMNEEAEQKLIYDYIDQMVSKRIGEKLEELATRKTNDMNIWNAIGSQDNTKEYLSNMKVKTNLGNIIDENGLKITWIAEKTGINRATLYNIIENPSSISLLNAYKLSLLLEMKIEELFKFEENEK